MISTIRLNESEAFDRIFENGHRQGHKVVKNFTATNLNVGVKKAS